MKTIIRSISLFALLGLSSACSSGGGDSGPQQFSNQELSQFASSMLIISPATNSFVSDPSVTVTATIPAAASATKVDLFVDNQLVSTDSNGAPWEFAWPSYFWGDNNFHSISLNAQLSSGQAINSVQQHQILVSNAVASSLEFAAGVDRSSIQDKNTLDVNFNPIESASHYELEVTIPSPATTLQIGEPVGTLTDLAVGTYFIRYRGGLTLGSANTRFGPWSSSARFDVLAPDLPTNIETSITLTDALHEATLSWDAVLPSDKYTVSLFRQGAMSAEEFLVTDGTTLTVPDLPIGNHTWTLSRENAFGHTSVLSNLFDIEAGVFVAEFGGSKNELLQQIVPSTDGGAVILALTRSQEISGQAGDLLTSWIFKVNELGELQWQYVAPGFTPPRYQRMLQLSNGSIIAYGFGGATGTTEAIKLDANGVVNWQRTYAGDGPGTTAYNFGDNAVTDTEIILLTSEYNSTHCIFNCQNPPLVKLQNLDPANGDLVNPAILPSPIPGYDILYASNVGFAANGNRYIGGTIVESGSDYSISSEAFVAEIDSQMATLSVWQTPGLDIDLQGLTQLANGEYVVSVRDNLMSYQLVKVSSDLGTSIAATQSNQSYSALIGSAQEMSDGRLFSLFPESLDPRNSNVLLFELDSSLNTVNTFPLPADAAASQAGKNMILYEDNTALLVYRLQESINSDYDLAVRKVVFTADP